MSLREQALAIVDKDISNIDALKETAEEDLKVLEEYSEQLEQNIKYLEEEIAKGTGSYEQDIINLQQQITDIEEKIQQIQVSADLTPQQKQDKIISLENKIFGLESIITNLQPTIEGIKKARAEQELALAAAKETLDKVNARKDRLSTLEDYESFLINYSFEEQCFLTANIEHIAKESVNYERISTAFQDNLLMLTDTNPFTFITKLTQYPTTKYFFEAQNYELSGIVPMIKLFKVFNDTDDEFQIPFEVNSGVGEWATPVDSLKDRGTRAIGIGIKSFSAKLNGNNPFAVKKSISANLQIYAASFSELARERKYNGNKFRYLDLALKTGKNPNTNTPNDILNFRLKAVIGWSKPRISLFKQSFTDAINDSYITLNLTPTIHKFTFDETGAVTFDIEYLSYIDDFFEQPVFNIFSSARYEKLKAEHDTKIEELKTKKCNASTDKQKEELDKEFEEKNKDFQENLASLKKLTLQQTIKILSNNEKIYSINIPMDEIYELSKKGFAGYFNNYPQQNTQIQTASASVGDAVSSSLAPPPTGSDAQSTTGTQSSFSPFINIDTENVLFFYVRDLFDVIMTTLDKKLNKINKNINPGDEKNALIYDYFKKLKLTLGPIELKDSQGNKRVYNIGSIPISLKSYLSWMTTKVITTEQDEYPFLAFCRSFFNEFITSQINNAKCYLASNTSQRVNLRENFITSYNDLGLDFKNNSITNTKFGDYDITTIDLEKPYLKVSGPNKDTRSNLPNKEEFHYLVFDASESIPNDSLKGDYTINMNSGVFHFISGRQEGIVKQINFTATSATGLAEVRFEQEGYNGLYQLMSVYDVDITTMGMFNMYPGCVIYVDPRGLDPVNTNINGFDLTNLGIGGYCVVIDVSHQLEAGVCETKIIARWVASKDKSYFNQIIAKENATDVDVSCSNPAGAKQ